MTEQLVNFAVIRLSADCQITDNSITVDNPGALPATGTYTLAIGNPLNEAVIAGTKTGSVIAITRGVGAEGYAALFHASGSPVVPILTARSVRALLNDLNAANGVNALQPIDVSVTNAGGTSSTLPVNGARFRRIYVNVTSAFDPGTKVNLGRAGNHTLLASGIPIDNVGLFPVDILVHWDSSTEPVLATLVGTSVGGAAEILFEQGAVQT